MTGSRPLRAVGGRPMPFSGPLEAEAPAATGVKAQVSFDRRIDRILLALLGRRSRSVRTLAREIGTFPDMQAAADAVSANAIRLASGNPS